MARRSDGDQRFEAQLRAIGFALLRLQQANGGDGVEEPRVTDIRFKLDADNRTSVLVVLKGVQEGQVMVAFAGGPDLETAVIAVGKKVAGGALRWREDRPWQGS